MICIHDLGCAELVDRFIRGIDAEIGLQRVRDMPSQNLASVPVHDDDQIQKTAPHWQIGEVCAPKLVWPIRAQPWQQVGVNLMPLRGLAVIRFLLNQHQPH
jgi:hypothetical protein